MAKTGRPKIEIDFTLVESLANIFCTQEEIAAILDCSPSTLQHNPEFLQVYKKGLQTAKSSLRRMQFKLAENNAALSIWLGKQYLGQREPAAIEQQPETDIPKDIDNLTPQQIDEYYNKLRAN